MLLANKPAQAESLLYSLEQEEGDIGLYMNSDKTNFMCFELNQAISILNGKPLKLRKQFSYLGSNISSTENDVSIGKAWIAIDRLMIIWKLVLSYKIKQKFFPAVAMSVLLYGCTISILMKCFEKKLNGNDTRR